MLFGSTHESDTRNRVLDSRRVSSPAYCHRFRVHVDDYVMQHRDIRNTFPQLQGLYHDRRETLTSAAKSRAFQRSCIRQTSVWFTLVGHISVFRSPPIDTVSPSSYPLVYIITVSAFYLTTVHLGVLIRGP